MADLRHGGRPGREVSRWLAASLRREARRERPAFSAALHGRVLDAVATQPREARRPAARAPALIAGLGVAAACALVAVGWVASRPATRAAGRDVAAGNDSAPGIERLPTPGEIGADVLAEVTTLAAAAVGMPEWTDLAGFDPAAFAAADDAGR